MSEHIEQLAKAATYGGSGVAVIFGLSVNEFAALVGILIGIAGYITNLIFTWRRDRREAQQLQRWRPPG